MIKLHRSPTRATRSAATLLIIGLATSVAGCHGTDHVQPRTIDSALTADFERVGAARVYFGHQSVGGNILSGLADLQGQLDRPLIRVAELGALDAGDGGGVLLQTAIGQNGKPNAKCEDFRQVMRQLQGRVDVALFKFCYIDFDDQSNAAAIFDTYSRTMDEMKRQYPAVTFVHVTAPLRSIERGPGVWARELLGKRNRAKHANAARGEFNRLLRERYAADPIFDLAAVMSTYPDGRRETFTLDGRTYESLVPAYTNDGGHLNAVGATYGAAGFVESIAAALRSRGGSQGPQAGQ
jgi:hypothetical protein